jgi:hypothetical protein
LLRAWTPEEVMNPWAFSRRRRLQNNIPAGAVVEIMFTNITSPSSTRPTAGSIEYTLKTAAGAFVEEQLTGLILANRFT